MVMISMSRVLRKCIKKHKAYSATTVLLLNSFTKQYRCEPCSFQVMVPYFIWIGGPVPR